MARFSTYLMNHWEERHKPFQSISPAPAEKALRRQDALHRACLHQRRAARITLNEWLPRSERKNSINRCGFRCSVWCPGLPLQPFLCANHRQRCPEVGQVVVSNPTDKKTTSDFFYFLFSFSRFKHCRVVIQNRALSHTFIFTPRIHTDLNRSRDRLWGRGLNFPSVAGAGQPDRCVFIPSSPHRGVAGVPPPRGSPCAPPVPGAGCPPAPRVRAEARWPRLHRT